MASKKEIKSKAKKAGKLVLKTTKNLAAKTGKSIVANPKSTAYVLVARLDGWEVAENVPHTTVREVTTLGLN